MRSSTCNAETQTPDAQQTYTHLVKAQEQKGGGQSHFCAACMAASPRSLLKQRLLGVQVQLQVVGYIPCCQAIKAHHKFLVQRMLCHGQLP